MVASKIVVQTKKVNSEQAYAWVSDGKGKFEISECVKEEQGTEITLFLKEEDSHFASRWEIDGIVKKYSEHIPFPIFLTYTDTKFEGEGIIKKKLKKKNASKSIKRALYGK